MSRLNFSAVIRASVLLLLLLGSSAEFSCADRKHTIDDPVHLGSFIHEVMVEYENKILMDWSPKAACSRSVAMFFEHMDYHFGRDYTWPHDERKRYYERCGQATSDHYLSDDWYRFKMVRNPFTRLPSGYHHYMIYHHTVPQFKGHVDKMSFADFVKMVAKKNFNMNHVDQQARSFEIEAAKRGEPSPYHKIVKVENPQPALDEINKLFLAKNPSFRPFVFYNPDYSDDHEAKKHRNVTQFVGYQPWREHSHSIPANYSHYYNEELKELTLKMFHWDFVLYNYSWPF